MITALRTRPVRERKRTRTSSFGVSKREGHDSSAFYARRLYEGSPKTQSVAYEEHPVPPEVLDRIFLKSSESMEELPSCSVHLVVTSPPYNVGKEYDRDLSLPEYLGFFERVMREVWRVLVPGGRVCINVANVGRKPYVPLHAFIAKVMLDIGFLMRGEIIWDKGASAGTSTAWGSWMSPSNPTLRDTHEYILVFSKGMLTRPNPLGRPSTISREEFLEFTKSVWRFPAESARRVGHPAPFPVELPRRCILLYTFEGEIVLDPFMGSGTTAVAALLTKRHFVGYEIEERYIRLAERRIKEVIKAQHLTLFGT